MNIQFASDLHLEFSENKNFLNHNPILPSGEILILAGDIVPFNLMDQHTDFFKFCADHFAFTYWLPGNHEYYNINVNERIGQFKEDILPNVHLVNNYWAHHGNARLIFSTLWTPISMNKAWHIQNGINDYHAIQDDHKRFSPKKSSALFEENLKFIQEAVANSFYEKCIVATHHAPTFINYPEEFKDSIYNEAFAVELSDYISSSSIDYWIYGHHHRNVPAFKIGNTELLTNQLGYVQSNEHNNFNSSKCIKTN